MTYSSLDDSADLLSIELQISLAQLYRGTELGER
jgi:hypothetical protein